MRIGTWNLAGRWSAEHARVLADQACDVWLLTEAPSAASLAGCHRHFSGATPVDAVHWAGLLTHWELTPRPDPEPASASAEANGVVFCSSVLPWPLCGPDKHWPGRDHTSRMAAALEAVIPTIASVDAVWGGDWNQPLTGNLAGFSRRAQDLVADSVRALGLQVPTSELPARNDRQSSIDHIAVPESWRVTGAGRVRVPEPLSDHDLYWVAASP